MLTQFGNCVWAQDIFFVQGSGKVYVQSNAEVYIHGGVSLQNGSLLSNYGSITLKQTSVSGAANWTDHTLNSYFHGNGRLICNGTGGHLLNSKNSFGRVDINSSGHVTLGADLNTHKLSLINGRVNTTLSWKLISLSDAQLAVEADPSNLNYLNSWINGTLRRYVSPSAVNSYDFPIGDSAKPTLAVISNLNADPVNNVNYLDARFAAKPGNDLNLYATEGGLWYVAVSSGGVWYLTPDIAPTSGKYDLLLYFNGFSDLADNEFAILTRPAASSNAADWQVPPVSSIDALNNPGRILSAGYARRRAVTGFGQLGIGTITPGTLTESAILLLAQRLNREDVKLNWNIRSEDDCIGYNIERRNENETFFKKVAHVSTRAVNGNSATPLSYDFVDRNPFSGISYYRIVQLKQSGWARYSNISYVNGFMDDLVKVSVYPNPTSGNFYIQADGINHAIEGAIMDISGRVIKNFNLTGRLYINMSDQLSGTYFVKLFNVFGPGLHYTKKIIIM